LVRSVPKVPDARSTQKSTPETESPVPGTRNQMRVCITYDAPLSHDIRSGERIIVFRKKIAVLVHDILIFSILTSKHVRAKHRAKLVTFSPHSERGYVRQR